MLKEFVSYLLELKRPEIVKVDDREYSTLNLTAVTNPHAKAIEVHTLSAFVDYLKSNVDTIDPKKCVVHVESFDKVRLLSSLDEPWRQREILVHAGRTLHGEGFKFGQYHDVETFIVELQSKFIQTDVTRNLLGLVGNITQEGSVKTQDDGVSQTVTQRAGIALLTEKTVPNPVMLQPYRTFLEVEQPESAFVYRVKKSRDGDQPQSAFFEADGGRWKITAIKNIRAYLATALQDFTVVA